MKVTTREFNPFDYMETQAEIIEYLQECMQEDDPSIFINALGHLAKRHGMSNIAKQTGLSRESMYRSLNGTTQPKWDTVFKVMKCLNVRLDVKACI